MNVGLFRCLAIAAAVTIAPVAFAAAPDGLEYQSERTVKLKSGKTLTVIHATMNGKMMAIIPMDDMHDLFERAEGHSMATDD
jgi:hypothetical protein